MAVTVLVESEAKASCSLLAPKRHVLVEIIKNLQLQDVLTVW